MGFQPPCTAQPPAPGYPSQTSATPCLGGEEVSGLGSVLALGCLEAAAC